MQVDGGGFEPPKALLTDLQSAPFGHSGIHPCHVESFDPDNNYLYHILKKNARAKLSLAPLSIFFYVPSAVSEPLMVSPASTLLMVCAISATVSSFGTVTYRY